MKKKIAAIMCSAVFVLCIGVGTAYYNTKSFGFDENAKVLSYDNEKISIMDFDIYYDDITDIMERIIRIVPERSQTVQI